MIHGVWSRFRGDQKEIAVLETAIILTAFVVVAPGFAYTILSTGIYSSEKEKEKEKEAIDSGLATARTSMQHCRTYLCQSHRF